MRWPSLSASGGSSFFQSWGREGEGGRKGRKGRERRGREDDEEEGGGKRERERSGIDVRVTAMYECNGRSVVKCLCCVGCAVM